MRNNYKLLYHLYPEQGWMNDPNGLCFFKGYYHVYYQYSKEAVGGLKYWGHFRSKDLLNWESLDIFLSPDKDFDKSGVYSGSALVHEDKLYIYYTGNVKEAGDYDYIYEGRQHNTVLVVSEDGMSTESRQVVLYNKDYPSDMSCHVRDPKVFAYDDKFYMVLGARSKDDKGQVLVYESTDLYNWNYINSIKTDYDFGYMWECPDLFLLDGKWVLLLSPQGIERKEFEAQNVYTNGYFILDGDFRSEYTLSEYRDLDFGFDFYACQTFEKDGKRYMLAWMGMPDAEYTAPTIEDGWQHAMTCFRELSLKDDKLIINPIKELESIFEKPLDYVVNKSIEINLETYAFDLRLSKLNSEFSLNFSEELDLVYKDKVLKLIHKDNAYGRGERKLYCEDIKELRILMDKSSVEIFVNSGMYTMTSRYYSKSKNIGINFRGNAALSIALLKENYVAVNLK